MKKAIHNFFKKIKKKKNLSVILLTLLTFIISILVIGMIKTLILTAFVIFLIFMVKNGDKIMSKLNTKKTSEPKRKKKKKRILHLLGLGVILTGILIVIAGVIFMGYIVIKAPQFDPKNLYRKEASIIYDSDNKVIAKIGREIRDKITYNDMPQVFIDAIIATEDSRFFQHNGFDLPRFVKASMGQLAGNSGAGGASTISMQVVKNNFTSTKQTVFRKFTDIYLAIFELEKHYTKEEILEFYVNAPYLGNNSYGVAEAARNYFGKELKDINLSEAALLAGIFQAPGAYDPTIYPENAAKRRQTVLYLMKRHGYISAEEEKIANSIPVASLMAQSKGNTSSKYQGYIDIVVEEVIKKTGNDPYNVPMKIYTNLITEKQDYINRVMSGEIFTYENDAVQAAVAVTNVESGAIVAIGNGRNRNGERIFNYATMMKKQIGSTAKPIFDYGPGMEFNNWSTYTPFVDDEYTYSNGIKMNNWDGKYMGMITLRTAIAESRNVPALKAFQQVKNTDILKFAQSLGMTPEIDSGHIHEAHAIGAFSGTTPLQLAIAYAAFANGGYYVEPFAVKKIEYIDSNEVELYKPVKTRVMSESTAFMIADILRYAVNTKAVSGKVDGVDIGAKSGTSSLDEVTKKKLKLPSSAINDLWYAGITPEYSLSMWYGYEKMSSTHYNRFGVSSNYRNKLFATLTKGIFNKVTKKFTAPSSVVAVEIEKDTIPAMLPSAYTPSNMRLTEYFKKGAEPTEVSPRFSKLPSPTGLDVTNENNNYKLSWNKVTAPKTVTEEYLNVIKNQQEKYLNIRSSYDANVLGTIGYNVYLKNNNQLTFLGFTANNSFTHKPTSGGKVTYVVKTCYSIFKSNESEGAEIAVSDESQITLIDISLVGNATVTVPVGGTYNESTDAGVQVLENLINVTADATITKTTTKLPSGTPVNGIVIDSSVSGVSYRITYNVKYKEETKTLTRTINIQ